MAGARAFRCGWYTEYLHAAMQYCSAMQTCLRVPILPEH